MDIESTGTIPSLPRGGRGPFLNAGGRAAAFLRCRRGVSAVEFSLFAPILAISLLASVDLGMAIAERMAMDHALRSGAQSAMADPGEATVRQVINTTAQTNFPLSNGISPLTVSVSRYCVCPQNQGASVACSTICTSSKPTLIFYHMESQKTYRGRIIPAIRFNRAARIQVR